MELRTQSFHQLHPETFPQFLQLVVLRGVFKQSPHVRDELRGRLIRRRPAEGQAVRYRLQPRQTAKLRAPAADFNLQMQNETLAPPEALQTEAGVLKSLGAVGVRRV